MAAAGLTAVLGLAGAQHTALSRPKLGFVSPAASATRGSVGPGIIKEAASLAASFTLLGLDPKMLYAIIFHMTLKQDLEAFQARWKAVEEIQTEERRSASYDLRWRQLNTAYGIAKGLGILQADPSEMEVIKRWAYLRREGLKKTANSRKM